MKETRNTVAVADSDILEAEGRAKTFEKAGFNAVAIESNGIAFLKTIQMRKPDIIVMDLILPGIDGFGIIESIFEESNLEYCPIIIIVSRINADERISEVISMGIDYYMLKPVSNQLVLRRANQLLQKKSKTNRSNEPAVTEQLEKIPVSTQPISENTKEDLVVTKDAYNDVTEILLKTGIPAHIKGYQYLRESIVMSVYNPAVMQYVTKLIYPPVAKKFSTTTSSVERTIRHAITVGWRRGDVDYLAKTFGFTVDPNSGKPTNSEFIALIADKLRLAYRE